MVLPSLAASALARRDAAPFPPLAAADETAIGLATEKSKPRADMPAQIRKGGLKGLGSLTQSLKVKYLPSK